MGVAVCTLQLMAGEPLKSPPVAAVQAQDVFWAPKFQVIRERTIPIHGIICNGMSGRCAMRQDKKSRVI